MPFEAAYAYYQGVNFYFLLSSKFFHSVFSTNTDPMTMDNSFPDSSICSINTSLDDTFTALTSLDSAKAMGGDGIPTIILKRTTVALLEPIHHLFDLCLLKSCLPKEWRSHRITPIFKSGDRSVVSNYRPVSLLCCISKVLERIVFDKVCDSVVTSSISDKQFGFVSSRSTLQQLLLYGDFLSNAYDDRHRWTLFIWTYGRPLTQFLMLSFSLRYGLLVSLVTCGVFSRLTSVAGNSVL